MRKFIITLCLLLLAATAWAEFLKDPIITSPSAVWTDIRAYRSAATAINSLSSGTVLSIVGNQTLGEVATVPAGCTLNFQGNGSLYLYANATLIINGSLVGPEHQLLAGAGSVNGTPQNTYVFPAWYQSTLTMNWDADEIGTFGGLIPVYKTSNYNATRQEVIHANTLGGNFTVSLPTSPLDDGNQVGFLDIANNFANNALRVDGNGKLINGEAFFDLDVNSLYTTVTYSATNNTWYFTIQPSAGTIVGFGSPGQHLITNSSGDGYTWGMNNASFIDRYIIADATANASTNYWCNTTSGSFTLTLPASPTDGDEVGIGDASNTFNATGCSLTLDGNGGLIENATSWDLDILGMYVKVRYVDALSKWRFLEIPIYGN